MGAPVNPKYEIVPPSSSKYEIVPPAQAVPQGVLDNLRAKSAQPTQFEQDRNPANQPGIFRSAVSELGNFAKAAPSAIAAGFEGPAAGAASFVQNAAKTGVEDQMRASEGRSGLYRGTAAGVSSFAPVANVRKMEEQSNVGNWRGVLGTAIGDAAPAVAPIAYEKGAPVVGDALKNRSYSLYNNVLGTKGRNMAFGANPGRGVAAEGIWGGKNTLAAGVKDAISNRGVQQEQVLGLPQNDAKALDVSGAVNEPFKSAVDNGLQGTTPDKTIRKLQQAHQEVTSNRELDPNGQITYTGRRNLSAVSPLEANKLKTSLYDRTNYQTPDLDEQVNTTLRQSAHGVNQQIESAVPEVKPFNQRLSDLYGADTSLSQMINNRMVSPTASGFTEVAPSVIGTAAGGPVGGAALTAVRETARLPAVKTGVAQGLYKVGNFLSPDAPLTVPSARSAYSPPPRSAPLGLPSGPMVTPPPADPSGFVRGAQPPAYNATTRAQRLGLLLPERTGIPMGAPPDQSGFVSAAANPPVNAGTRAGRLGLLLPQKAGGTIPGQATPVDSPLWNKLQKQGRRP